MVGMTIFPKKNWKIKFLLIPLHWIIYTHSLNFIIHLISTFQKHPCMFNPRG